MTKEIINSPKTVRIESDPKRVVVTYALTEQEMDERNTRINAILHRVKQRLRK